MSTFNPHIITIITPTGHRSTIPFNATDNDDAIIRAEKTINARVDDLDRDSGVQISPLNGPQIGANTTVGEMTPKGMTKSPERPCDTNQLAKLMVDILTGEVELSDLSG